MEDEEMGRRETPNLAYPPAFKGPSLNYISQNRHMRRKLNTKGEHFL